MEPFIIALIVGLIGYGSYEAANPPLPQCQDVLKQEVDEQIARGYTPVRHLSGPYGDLFIFVDVKSGQMELRAFVVEEGLSAIAEHGFVKQGQCEVEQEDGESLVLNVLRKFVPGSSVEAGSSN